jgi:glycerol kinase
MQMQANVLGVTVQRGKVIETTALGAAFLAGLGAKLFKSTADLSAIWIQEHVFEPSSHHDLNLSDWRQAVATVIGTGR